MSLFSAVEMAPRDPILGLNEAFNADTRTTKVNLGVGVYCNEEGKIPLLRAVAEAEDIRVAQHAPRGYLPIDGIAAYDKAVQTLLFGAESPLLASGRVMTVQAVGGTGALKIGADFLKQLLARRRCGDQRPELGKPPRPVRNRRFPGAELSLLRRRHPRREPRGHAGRPANPASRLDRRPARVLPQPDRR